MTQPQLSHEAEQVEVYDGTSIRIFPAPMYKRALALAVDYSIVSLALYAALILLLVVFGGLAATMSLAGDLVTVIKTIGRGASLILVILLASLALLSIFGLVHGYFIYFEFNQGSTPGKKLFGLQVISAEGGRLTLRQCMMREVFRSFLDAPLIFPALISMLLTTNRQRLGDLVAGTIVVHSKRMEQAAESTFVPQEYYADLLHRLKPKMVPEAEAREFLRFCNARFLSGEEEATREADGIARWEPAVRAQVNEEAATIDAQSLILFYAEFLIRTLR